VELRRDILRGTIRPGDVIKERDTSAKMGVSRTPLREAIRILADEGLIELRPSRSPIVAQPSFKELCDSVEVLITLETLAGELVCSQGTDAGLARILDANEKMRDKWDMAERIDIFEMDMVVHREIAIASENIALERTHRAYLARLWRARYLASLRRTDREQVWQQHVVFVDALMKRDAAAYRAGIQEHLGRMYSDFRVALEAEARGDPVDFDLVGDDAPAR